MLFSTETFMDVTIRKRVATFSGWRKPDHLHTTVTSLAKMGYMYNKKLNQVQCDACNEEITELLNITCHKVCSGMWVDDQPKSDEGVEMQKQISYQVGLLWDKYVIITSML